MIPQPVLAHPLLVQGELPVSAFVLAIMAVCVLLLVSAGAGRLSRPAAGVQQPPAAGEDALADPAGGPRRLLFLVARAVGVGLLALAIAAGLFGAPDELSNIAPALIVGAGWPLLVLASLLLGRVWWWINPFDTVARLLSPLGAGDGPTPTDPPPVWGAAAAGAVWMGYLTVWPTVLSPRSVGTVLAVYTVTTLAGCLALGRRAWLARAEFFTVFFGLLAGVRRRGAGLALPPGGAAVCGVVAGAALFGLIRDSDLGTLLAYGPQAVTYSRVGVGVAMLVAGGLAEFAARRREGAGGASAVGVVPAAAGLALAMALARYRLTTSLQLLPVLASDPFGVGLDLFGTRAMALQARPFSVVTLIWTQATVVVLGAAAGVALARRRAFAAAGRRRVDAVLMSVGILSLFTAVGVAAVGAF